MTFRAAAALPGDDRGRALEALRQQLLVMAAAEGVTPDWTTLTVSGPAVMAGADEDARYEWTASVAVRSDVSTAAGTEVSTEVGTALES